jgi:transcriptional regulator
VYIPQHFVEDRVEALTDFVRANPFCTLVTHGPDGLFASHIPLLLDSGAGPKGLLRGHLAKANPQWRTFAQDADVLAIFNGPHHYISPSWYPSKAEHGKVVPTWNYVAVHAYGQMRIVEDRERLLEHLRKLTDSQEVNNPERWHVDDAPAEYIDGLTKAIVGVEIEIGRMEGKWKVSQNRPAADREAVTDRLRNLGGDDAVAMAALIENPRAAVDSVAHLRENGFTTERE